jgi:ACS family D-galactonate transporter-like MFS transporter
MLALVAVATMVNYLDRTCSASPRRTLTKELGLTAASMGIVFSAFSWSYALLQIPGGIFLDRFGTRITYSLALTLWSGLHRFHGRRRQPADAVVRAHRRRHLRGAVLPRQQPHPRHVVSTAGARRANSIYSVGQYAGIAFLSVPLFWVTQQFGWRGLFFLAGGFGIVLGALMWSLYREPSEIRTLVPGAGPHRAGGGGEYRGARTAFSWSDIGRLLKHRRSSAHRSASSAATRRRCSS